MRLKLARTLVCGLADEGVERGEIRHVGRAREQLRQPGRRVLGSNGTAQAHPQDLRKVLIEPHRRPQHFRVLGAEHAKPPGLVEHARGRGVEDVRHLGGMNELQILRDELDVDQAAGDVFEIPAIALALLARDRLAHLDHVGGRPPAASRGRHSTARITLSTRAANSGLARNDARARQRHVLPGPGLGLLVARRSRRSGSRAGRSGRTGAAACRPDRGARIGRRASAR